MVNSENLIIVAQIKNRAKKKCAATKVLKYLSQDLVCGVTTRILIRMKTLLYFIVVSLLFGLNANAGLLHTYNELTVMDLDQMNALVQEKIKESKKADAKVVPLKEALQAIYSRPDADRMIEKVASPVRFELDELGEYQRIMRELVEEALNALKRTRNFKPSVQVTYIVFLENFMGENKKAATREDGFERGLIKKIKKAKIKLTKEAINERNVKGFKEKRSPSETAAAVLEGIEQAEKEAKKSEEKSE